MKHRTRWSEIAEDPRVQAFVDIGKAGKNRASLLQSLTKIDFPMNKLGTQRGPVYGISTLRVSRPPRRS